MNWKNIIPIIIGLALFLIIIINADLAKIIEILINLEPAWFVAAITLNILVIGMKTLKWKILIDYKKKISFKDALTYFLIGFFFSTITPGRIGDIVRAKYLREKTGLAYATTSVILDRLIDIVLLLIIGLIATIITAELFGVSFFSPTIIVVILFAIGTGLYAASNKKIGLFFFKLFHKHVIPEKFKEKSANAFDSIYNSVEIFKENKILMVKATLIGAVTWIMTVIMVYFLSLSISMNIQAYSFFLIVPLMALSDMIPLSVGGLGPRELITISALALFSITYEKALSFSLLYFFSGYLLVSLVGSIIYMKRKIRIKKQVLPVA
ncbi:MAG: flippase-like domain-containing protein [archaeon]|nr:flippase-like domain-containing protein [archaeon]